MVAIKFISTAVLAFVSAVVSVNAKFTGDTTYYIPSQVGDHKGIGACGTKINDWDYAVAVSHKYFDTYPGASWNPNANPICHRRLRATYQGKSVTVTVLDRCEDCEGQYAIDLTLPAFQQLEPNTNNGRLFGVEWDWV